MPEPGGGWIVTASPGYAAMVTGLLHEVPPGIDLCRRLRVSPAPHEHGLAGGEHADPLRDRPEGLTDRAGVAIGTVGGDVIIVAISNGYRGPRGPGDSGGAFDATDVTWWIGLGRDLKRESAYFIVKLLDVPSGTGMSEAWNDPNGPPRPDRGGDAWDHMIIYAVLE